MHRMKAIFILCVCEFNNFSSERNILRWFDRDIYICYEISIVQLLSHHLSLFPKFAQTHDQWCHQIFLSLLLFIIIIFFFWILNLLILTSFPKQTLSMTIRQDKLVRGYQVFSKYLLGIVVFLLAWINSAANNSLQVCFSEFLLLSASSPTSWHSRCEIYQIFKLTSSVQLFSYVWFCNY